MPDAPRTRAASVDLDRATGLTVTFGDGHTCAFSLDELRSNCPCASCRALRERDIDPHPGIPVAVDDARLAGNWGLQIDWRDGHATGIYAWDVLRAWCDERDDPAR